MDAPKLEVDENTLQISLLKNETDSLSRSYNMIFCRWLKRANYGSR